jgi:hypothetical protein
VKPYAEIDINRISHPSTSSNPGDNLTVLPDPRILILSVSPDLSTSYIPIMNSIFSAQKLVRRLCLIFDLTMFISNEEGDYRCLQNIWSRHSILATSGTLDRRLLYLPRTSGSSSSILNRASATSFLSFCTINLQTRL